MTLQHTPLDASQLSPTALRAVGPGPTRMMAARGVVPLPPADQLAVLYQLALDPETSIAQAARLTAGALPDRLLAGTLADPRLDPRVIDFYAGIAGMKSAVFDAVALNPTTADATFATIAEKCSAREVDQLAQNEQRLLRYPEIIAAMYMNRHARMSTVDRLVELAVRNNVKVPGIAAWDEIARAIVGAPASLTSDAAFDAAAAALSGDDSLLTVGDPEEVLDENAAEKADSVAEVPKDVPINQLSVPHKIRLAQLGNAFARNTLIRDPMKLVAVATIKSGGVTEVEAARYAGNQALCEEVIRHIASRRDWTKRYSVKVSLCRNPKTPVADVQRMLPFLREKDLQALTKSKGVASAVQAQARKLMLQRKGGSGK